MRENRKSTQFDPRIPPGWKDLDWGMETLDEDKMRARVVDLRDRRTVPVRKVRIVKTAWERLSGPQQKVLRALVSGITLLTWLEDPDTFYSVSLGESLAGDPTLRVRKPTITALIKAGFLSDDLTPKVDGEEWKTIPKEEKKSEV